MGEIYFQQRRFEQAEDFFRKASIGTCHGNPAPLYQRALSFMRMQKFDRAQAIFEDVIELHPTSQFAREARGQLREIKSSPSLNQHQRSEQGLTEDNNSLRNQIRAQRAREQLLGGGSSDEIGEILPDLFEGPSF